MSYVGVTEVSSPAIALELAEYERNSEPGPQDRATIATRSGRSFTYGA